jgi:putative pyruvate formate lyase activating enzyme
MISTTEIECHTVGLGRSALARSRVAVARRMLSSCCLCAHHCGVNRLAGERGLCGAGDETHVFSAQVEVGDELLVSPTYAVALSGCDLRCDFCITGHSSWNSRAGSLLEPGQLAGQTVTALESGAQSVMILGGEPSIHLPFVLAFIAELPDTACVVWKTNGHQSRGIRHLVDGIFDVWLVDLKFGNPECAERLAGVPGYMGVVTDNLIWAHRHADLIVRHLLLPGHLDCCWKRVANWLATELPGVKVSLRTEFWPGWHSKRHTELRGVVSTLEAQHAFRIGKGLGLNLVE